MIPRVVDVAVAMLFVCGCAATAPSAAPTPTPTIASSATSTARPATPRTVAPASPVSSRATFSAGSLIGRMVFAHDGDIWVMNADGSQRTQLTDDPAEDFDPAWSPDGTQIAFRSQRDGDEEVYLMAADGSRQRNLTQSPTSDYSPAWSPDGSQIAFATNRDPDSGGNDIYVISVETGQMRRLTVGGGIDEYPTWSPDGDRIAYACSRGRLPEGVADFDVCAMNSDGTESRRLTDAPGVSDYPAWSPDGAYIAFMSTRGGWPTLPAYTPPAYEPGSFGEYDIYVMAADGTGVRNLTQNGREDEQFPAWSPDGEHVVFSRYGCLVAATLAGSAEAVLTVGAPCADGFPDWRR